MLLLGGDKTNQSPFLKFLFHLVEVIISIDFAHEKNLFLTGFAQRKLILWKSCGLSFQFFPDNISVAPYPDRVNKKILEKLLSAVILSVS